MAARQAQHAQRRVGGHSRNASVASVSSISSDPGSEAATPTSSTSTQSFKYPAAASSSATTPVTPVTGGGAGAGAGAGAGSGAEDRVRRRTRGLLKDFYGLEKKEEKKADPLDIDGPTFESELSLKKMLAEKPLDDLINTDNKFNNDIRKLDSDMKTLVYENYNKFISATDIIRKMKTNVADMDSKMKQLRDQMQTISDGSSKVNTSLIAKRNKINQLSGVHGLIRKIEFVFELPQRLKKCMETENYNLAWRYYSRTSSVLSHYGHLPSFTPIQRDCEVIMKKVAVKLHEKLSKEDTKPHDLTEAVQILLGLKESAQTLWKAYVSSQKKALQLCLHRANIFDPSDPEAFGAVVREHDGVKTYKLLDRKSSKPDNSTAASEQSDGEAQKDTRHDPHMRIAYLHESFLRDLMEFIVTYLKLFVNPPENSKSDLSEGDRRAADNDLQHIVDDMVKEYFVTVEAFLETKVHIGPSIYMDALSRLNDDLVAFDRHLNGRFKIINRARQVTNKFLLSYAEREFAVVETAFIERLKWLENIAQQLSAAQTREGAIATPASTTSSSSAAALSSSGVSTPKEGDDVVVLIDPNFVARIDDLVDLVHTVNSSLSRTVNETMSRLEVFSVVNRDEDESFMHAHLPAYIKAVVKEMAAFWANIGNDILKTGLQTGNAASNAVPLLTLVLSKLSLELENSTIGMTYTRLLEVFQSGVRRGAATNDLNEARSIQSRNAQALLQRYVELQSTTVSAMARLNAETKNWVTAREPRKHSKVWEQILEDIASIEQQVEQMYVQELSHSQQSSESSNRRFHSNNLPRPVAKSSSTGANIKPKDLTGASRNDPFMSNTIDKLFRQKIEVIVPVEQSRNSIMFAIVKIILKAFNETIRLRTFGRGGYQQIQLDAEYLRINLWQYAPENLLNTMIDEIISSAQSRCVDPVPMDPSVIEKLLSGAATAEVTGD